MVVTTRPGKTKNTRKKGGDDDDDDDDFPNLCHNFEKCSIGSPKKRSDTAANEGLKAIPYTPVDEFQDVRRPPSTGAQVAQSHSACCSKGTPVPAPARGTKSVEQYDERTSDGGEAGSVHYVEATAVRHLAAETGTIAILSSTASPSKQQRNQISFDVDDLSRLPVGVRERLDSEPGWPTPPENKRPEFDGYHPLIPLPVIRALESDPDGQTPVFETIRMPVHRPAASRQNNSSDRRPDDLISIWDPKTLPVFEKCKYSPKKSEYRSSRFTYRAFYSYYMILSIITQCEFGTYC